MDETGQFRIEIVDDVESHYVNLIGELDLAVSDSAWESLRPLSKPGEDMVLDLSRVTFIDSRGLNVLVRTINALKGGKLILKDPSSSVTRLLEISGLTGLVTIA